MHNQSNVQTVRYSHDLPVADDPMAGALEQGTRSTPIAANDNATPKPVRYLSLFTGIGGFELGLKKALARNNQTESKLDAENDNEKAANDNTKNHGNRRDQNDLSFCVGYSEIDKHALQIYRRHYPSHKNYGDITTIDESELPDFDLLVGGFPCQAFSIAGKRKGFIDTRGTLFFDIARIVRQKQPRLLLLENVKGLLSHDQGRTFTVIISTLVELGYDCQWQVLNSKDFGVPQNRERVFIVGHLRGTPRPEVFPLRSYDKATSYAQEWAEPAPKPASAITTREGQRKENNFIIEQLNNPTHSNNRVYGTGGVSPTLCTMQGGNRQPFVMVAEGTKKGYVEAEQGDSINLSFPNSTTRRGRVGKGVAQTLDTAMQLHTLTKGARIRRLTPTECERLQGFPDGWTEGVSDTQRYKALGNAVTVNVLEEIFVRLLSARPHICTSTNGGQP